MTKYPTIIEKVEVPGCPKVYVHVDHDGKGHIKGVALSEPTKWNNHAMGNLIVALNEKIESMIEDVSG